MIENGQMIYNILGVSTFLSGWLSVAFSSGLAFWTTSVSSSSSSMRTNGLGGTGTSSMSSSSTPGILEQNVFTGSCNGRFVYIIRVNKSEG